MFQNTIHYSEFKNVIEIHIYIYIVILNSIYHIYSKLTVVKKKKNLHFQVLILH